MFESAVVCVCVRAPATLSSFARRLPGCRFVGHESNCRRRVPVLPACLAFLRVGKTDRRTVYVSRRSVHLYPRCRRRRRLRQGSTSFVATDTVKPAWRGSSSPPPSHRRVCPSNAVVMLLVESPGTSNVCSSITRRRRRRRLRRLLPHFRSATNGSILHAIPRRPVTVSAQSKVLGVARLHLPTAFLL